MPTGETAQLPGTFGLGREHRGGDSVPRIARCQISSPTAASRNVQHRPAGPNPRAGAAGVESTRSAPTARPSHPSWLKGERDDAGAEHLRFKELQWDLLTNVFEQPPPISYHDREEQEPQLVDESRAQQ